MFFLQAVSLSLSPLPGALLKHIRKPEFPKTSKLVLNDPCPALRCFSPCSQQHAFLFTSHLTDI